MEGDIINAYSYSVNIWPNLSGCYVGLVSSCTNVDTNECCASLPAVDTCQVTYIPKLEVKRSLRWANESELTCTQVQPNVMGFVDEEGVKYEVYLP